MSHPVNRITVDKQVPGYWRVTLNHPPINTVDEQMYDELFDLVEVIDADPSLKVMTFESANPDFFLAHYGIGESKSRFDKPRWIETAARLARSSVLSIAIIRGRARGGGSEFALACDIRSPAKREPSSASPKWDSDSFQAAAHSNGSRSLLAVPEQSKITFGGDDFDAETAERCGWINRAVPDAELDGFVAEFVRRVLSFDSNELATSKAILNQTGLPDQAQLQETQTTFGAVLRSPVASERLAKARQLGLGAASEFELNLGHHAGGF